MALTEAQKRTAVKNMLYWSEREKEALKHYIKDEKEYDRQIEQIYKDMQDACQNEINAFYGRYAKAEGITLAEAKKRVSKLDIEAYERKAKRYVKNREFSQQANEEMRLYNTTMKINRLEMLKANIGLELIKGHDELEKYMESILQGRTKEELERQAGILGKTIRNNAKLAHTIPNASFHNAKFSDRIWMYQSLMRADLEKLLQTGLIQGKNARVLAKELKKAFGVSTYNAERLMRTELARVQIDAQKRSLEANGFEKYQFICNHNGNTCEMCKLVAEKNSGVYNLKDMQPGLNAPPLHPHCRCSIAAYEDSEEFEAWLDYLDKGGTTEDFNAGKPLTVSKTGNKMELSSTTKQFVEKLKRLNVSYNPVKKRKKPLPDDEIIKALAGGDKTKGSCASVGLAYIAQKRGMDVLDFRGGESQSFFSMTANLNAIARIPSSGAIWERAKSSLTIGNRLLKKVEKGKEYYLCTGRHAAIVRKTDDDKLQYLELQSQNDSGWHDFDGNPKHTLSWRFGCSSRGYGYEFEEFMIDLDEFKIDDDLQKLMGYVNTQTDEQKKGVGGSVK